MQENQLFTHFPSVREMYPLGLERRFSKQIRHVLRYFPRRLVSYRQGNELIAFLNQHPIWLPIFHRRKHRFHTILFHYCDKRFSVQERLQQVTNTILHIEQLLGTQKSHQLVAQGSILLADLGNDLGLYLNINEIDFYEGLFSLSIQDSTAQKAYHASFAILEGDILLVASMQGPSGEGAAEIVKILTKQLHGMRPMFMLVACFKWLAQCWGLSLAGIPHRYQTKVRFQSRQQIHFNYDTFWQENGGVYQNDYWYLPSHVERNDLEDVPSKKRSMYRKRYEQFDAVEQSIRQVVGQI